MSFHRNQPRPLSRDHTAPNNLLSSIMLKFTNMNKLEREGMKKPRASISVKEPLQGGRSGNFF